MSILRTSFAQQVGIEVPLICGAMYPCSNPELIAAVSGPAFSFIVGAAREDAVIDEHFAKVFNLDESLGDMMTNPRVIAGLLRHRVRTMLGRQRVPFGFDPAAEPPARDYSAVAAR